MIKRNNQKIIIRCWFPKMLNFLILSTNFTTQQLRKILSLALLVALESNVKAFQYKVINSILYARGKLCKIGFRINDACTFCIDEPDNLHHLD